jgi:serine protease DegS
LTSQHPKKPPFNLLLAIALGALGGVLITLALGPGLHGLKNAAVDNRSAVERQTADIPSYADAVARAAPSVVNIFTAKTTTERQAMVFKDPLLQHYYGRFLPEQTRKRMDTSLGSGVIVSAEGYVLTNLHIVDHAEQIQVVLADGGNVEVTLVGKDPDTDLAILKMDRAPASSIPIGKARDLRVGDVVLAIGNPFGVGQTVTQGIVSATGRSHLGISAFENFIQTDAAINPGNSGGALINTAGELVGVNTAIFSKSGGSHGIGFAIPSETANNVLRQILDHGVVVRGWLGLTGQDVTDAKKAAFGLHNTQGILVSGVLNDGPAEQAGLRAGDVITQIDRQTVDNIHDLLDMVANAGPHRELQISGWRGNQAQTWRATTAMRPKTPD